MVVCDRCKFFPVEGYMLNQTRWLPLRLCAACYDSEEQLERYVAFLLENLVGCE